MESNKTLPAKDVQAELERVLASAPFANSRRSQQFLRYIVESSLNNQDELLKEFAIAVDVFERDGSYDPSVDATVRVEAGRLRSRLRDYYAAEGRNDPLIIEVPKGGYRATFIRRSIGAIPATDEAANKPPDEVPPISSMQVAVQVKRKQVKEPNTAIVSPGHTGKLTFRLTITAAVLVAGLAVAFWVLSRPLPPPRITTYTKITRDGHEKLLTGTDGSRIYFTQFQPNAIFQVGVEGGEAVEIPSMLQGFFGLLDLSPDGSKLLVSSNDTGGDERALWIVRVLGGTTRRLGHGNSAAFSPDGNTVVYANNHGEIRLIQSDGTEDRKLASTGGAGELQWSPDGKVIRFDHGGELWEIAADGSNPHAMLPGWQDRDRVCCGRWTPDGKFYIFLTTLNEYRGDRIWALDERRGLFRHPSPEPVPLTAGPMNWRDPIPAKGANKIFANSKISRGELCRLDPKINQLQPFLGGISAQDVSFSKDGQFVAYVSYPDGILWKANRDGANPVQLSAPPIYATNPRWSPDGSKIVFSDHQLHSADRIYLASPQGGSPLLLLPDYPGNQNDPGWAADGRRIVFSSTGVNGKEANLVMMDFASRQVTPVPGSDDLFSPRWSPDGKSIAAFADQGVKVLDVATQRWSTLLLSKNKNYNAWSSDSKYIYFLRADNVDRGVYRIRATGGKEERVVDLKDRHITGLFTLWMALDPNNTPLLLRDVGGDDIYALTLGEK